MAIIYLAILIFVCAGLIIWGVSRRERMLQFPALVGWTISLLIIPQFFALLATENRLPDDSLQKVILMTIFCVVMTAAGYAVYSKSPSESGWSYNVNRLMAGNAILVVIGIAAMIMLSRLPKAMLETAWEGLPVRYLFFAGGIKYSFALSLILYTRYRYKIALFMMMPGLYEAVMSTLIGRRTSAAILFFTILCAFWFNRKKTVPQYIMVIGIIVFSIFVYSIGEYRTVARSDDYVGSLKKMEMKNPTQTDSLVNGVAIEMENAANIIEAVDRSGKHDMGMLLYNTVIASYVPRQLVGREMKESLMLPSGMLENTYEQCHYRLPVGSCTTGIAEAYYCFSFFGSFLFFIMGFVMRKLWEGSVRGNIVYQLLYISILIYAIGVYNGLLGAFISPWIHMLIFLGPIIIWAKLSKKDIEKDQEDMISAT